MGPSIPAPSSNWSKLKPTLPKDEVKPKIKHLSKKQEKSDARRKFAGLPNRGKADSGWAGRASGQDKMRGIRGFLPSGQVEVVPTMTEAGPSKARVTVPNPAARETVVLLEAPSDDPLVAELREMVAGRVVLNDTKRAPGNYIAIDCEMVGVNTKGCESAVARVSIINYHGHILLDTFVRPKERITDFRTWISGIREEDLRGAPGLEEVQAMVAELCEGRVLVGHAIDNDLKALFLSHPKPMIRDTQRCKILREKAKTKFPGLSRLSSMELGLEIQKGSHSSVTDARATMALYRLHKGPWEQELRHATESYKAKVASKTKGKGKEREDADAGSKRKRNGDDEGDEFSEDEEEEIGKKAKTLKNPSTGQAFPGGGKKGISSGLGLVIRRNGQRVESRQRGVPRPSVQSVSGGGGADGGPGWWETV